MLASVVRTLDHDPTLTVKQALRDVAMLVGFGDVVFNLCPRCGHPCLEIFVMRFACLSIVTYGGVPRSDVISVALMEQAHSGLPLAPKATAWLARVLKKL